MSLDPRACAQLAAEVLDEKKGEDIIVLDISEVSIMADYFVITSGRSSVHVKALADEVEKKLVEAGFRLRGKEGYNDGRWVLLDFYDCIIHIFHENEREYFNLERLWADAKPIELPVTTE